MYLSLFWASFCLLQASLYVHAHLCLIFLSNLMTAVHWALSMEFSGQEHWRVASLFRILPNPSWTQLHFRFPHQGRCFYDSASREALRVLELLFLRVFFKVVLPGSSVPNTLQFLKGHHLFHQKGTRAAHRPGGTQLSLDFLRCSTVRCKAPLAPPQQQFQNTGNHIFFPFWNRLD